MTENSVFNILLQGCIFTLLRLWLRLLSPFNLRFDYIEPYKEQSEAIEPLRLVLRLLNPIKNRVEAIESSQYQF